MTVVDDGVNANGYNTGGAEQRRIEQNRITE